LTEACHDVLAGEGEHSVSDLKTLRACLGAKDRRHLIVHHFDVPRFECSGRMRHR
jgi:hypothetical protein